MSNANDAEFTVRLLERRRSRATSDETATDERTVHCPLCVAAREVRHCRTCARFVRELEEGGEAWLECRVPREVAAPRGLCGELMSPEVTCLDCELDAERAASYLHLAGVSSAPVLDDNAVLIGMVSAAELAFRIEARGFDPGPLEVEDAMTTQVLTLTQRSTLGDAARLMAERHVDRVPIVTDDGHLVGVISALDLVRWLSSRIP